jgi:hypothetical protein
MVVHLNDLGIKAPRDGAWSLGQVQRIVMTCALTFTGNANWSSIRLGISHLNWVVTKQGISAEVKAGPSFFYRQCEMEGSALTCCLGSPEFAAVRLYQSTADGQTHAHAMWLGGDEGLKNLLVYQGANAGAVILHRNADFVALGR